ncbi:hypothetical protein [Virgibacillus sp. DJP39]|uniref:hypothetical protein n=1 Tax=Virgibacillus sp. DJP39 TaxID=3409790 RepID=UPI003BB65BC8
MTREDEHKNEINKLKNELFNYQKYVMKLPVYEYHIDKLKVEKVKGILQLGQLLVGNNLDHKGIHKVFVQDVIIHEIEGSGIVGIGVTEKEIKNRKKSTIITPKEASKEIKEIYTAIKKEFNLHEAPLFFQQLAVNEKVFKSVWDYISQNQSVSDAVNFLAGKVQASIEGATSTILQEQSDYDFIQSEPHCNALIKEIKDLAKTFAIVLLLLEQVLPGYLKEDSWADYKFGELEKVNYGDIEKLFNQLKKVYHVNYLTDTIKTFKDHTTSLFVVYNDIFIPFNQAGKDKLFVKEISEEIIQHVDWKGIEVDFNLSIDNCSFLFSILIQHLKDIPTWVYMDKIMLYVCKPD